METLIKDFKKYRWFYTSSRKLVLGGKSSTQNDELLMKLKRTKKDYLVMHTASPGSPFSVILADISEITEKDIQEVAIFTGCFSRKWREQAKKTEVDVFSLSQVYKLKSMSPGTWGVKGKINRMTVDLELVLAIQQNTLRAIPEKSVKNKKEVLLRIKPGKIDKTEMLPKFHVLLDKHFSQEELLSALPAGGVSIVK
jgi:hypothetical protein